MAVVGSRTSSRHLSMASSMQSQSHQQQHQAILVPAQTFYSAAPVNVTTEVPDRPIGYGAFGVVW